VVSSPTAKQETRQPTTATPGAAPSATATETRPASRGKEILLGELHRRGSYVCTGNDPGQGKWVNISYVAGFVPLNLSAEQAQLAKPWLGHPVLVTGQPSSALPAPPLPANTQRCSVLMQARSDWVSTPDGVRIQRNQGPRMPSFKVASIERFKGLKAQRKGDQLTVEFTNQLGRPLAAPVVIRVHYEGCYGKPGSTKKEAEHPAALVVGQTFSATFPAIATNPGAPDGRRVHSADSIEVGLSGTGIHADLDASLVKLGVDVKCPRN